MIGQTVSHYQITEKLGQGGMGVVYKAQDNRLDRPVALKFLPTHSLPTGAAKARFYREAKAAASLSHSSICTIHEIDESGGRTFIAMEFIDGETLAEKIKQGPLKPNEAVDVAMQMAAGLQAAHEKNIIHRDIKASNVMVAKEGVVKIVDFGLAKVTKQTQLTKTGTTLGTVAYMSPEQARGEEVDHRTDLWSLGVVLYEMLTGERPFRGDYEQAVLYAVLNLDPEPITALRADLPAVLGRVVRKALEKSPARRYSNMRALIEDLETDSSRETAAPELEKSIVVLPFTNLSPDPDQEYFSDGLTEEVIADLSQVRALRVISRTSSMLLKGTRKDVRTIGRELDVLYVLEGSVRKAGNKLRITAQLIDAINDSQLWAEKYQGTLDDVFSFQEDVSTAITSTLKLRLDPDHRSGRGRHEVGNVQAYEAYLQGRHEMGNWSRTACERAARSFQNAIEILGDNPLFHAGLGHTYFRLAHIVPGGMSKYMKKTESSARRALELDSEITTGHVLSGLVDWKKGRLGEALHHFNRAIQIDPRDADALLWACFCFAEVGDPGTVESWIKRLVRIDPINSFTRVTEGFYHLLAGRLNEASRGFARSRTLDPSSTFPIAFGALTEVYLDRRELALQLLDLLSEVEAADVWTHLGGALKSALKGETPDIPEEVDRDSRKDETFAWFLADCYGILGDDDGVLDWLQYAVEYGFLNVTFLESTDVTLHSVRKQSTFASLMDRARKRREEVLRRAFSSDARGELRLNVPGAP